MLQQRIPEPRLEEKPPWSLLSVTVLTFFLPAGGAVLTIRNLQRLGQLDSRTARQMTIAVLAVSIVGFTFLVSSSTKMSNGFIQPNTNADAILQFGVAFASYVALRGPFRAWRTSHQRARTSSWLSGLGVAALYTLITFVGVLPLYLAAQIAGLGTPVTGLI